MLNAFNVSIHNFFLDYLPFLAFGVDWHERVKIIYAGDDVTDEDAMQVNHGFELKITWP